MRARDVACLVGWLAAAACGGEASAPPAPPRIVVEFPVTDLEVGQTSVVTVFADDGARREVVADAVLSTSTPTIATISQNGELLAIAPGTVTIVATARGAQGQTTMRVVPVTAVRVAIAPGDSAIAIGSTVQLAAAVLDASSRPIPGRLVTWSSSDAAVATIGPNGVVRAVGIGVTRITATSDGVTGEAALRVRDPSTSVASISIQPARALMLVGESIQLSALLTDEDGAVIQGRPVTWSLSTSAGSAVARLSATGLLTADSVGSIVVEAVAEGQRATQAIRIARNVDTSIVVNFARPLKDGVVGDTLKILVSVDHPVAIESVVALLGTRRIELHREYFGFNGLQEGWAGMVDMSLLKFGPYQLDIVVTDINGLLGAGSQRFTRDPVKGNGGSPPPGPRSK